MNFNTNAPVCQNYDQVFSSVFFQSAVLELLGLAGGDFAGEEKVYRDALVATTKSAATEEQIGLTREILNSEFCTGQ